MKKLSSLFEEAAKNVAKEMLENGLSESNIPEMSSFLVSRSDACPNGYVRIGDVTVESVIFYIFQMF